VWDPSVWQATVQRCRGVSSCLGARAAAVLSQGDDTPVAWLKGGGFCQNSALLTSHRRPLYVR
jgi:hypothetical protein